MGRRSAERRERETVADLDALHRLDAHEREREPRVEPVLFRRVRAEPRRHARRAYLDDAADRVALGARLVDARAQAGLVDDAASHRDADRGQQRLRHPAGRDVDGGVPGRRAFERVADVVVAVLQHAGEVGVTGPRQRDGLRSLAGRLALGRPRRHPPRPVLVVDVAHDERERRSQGAPVPQACEHLDAVLFDLLPGRAAVAFLPPFQVGVDRLTVEREAGGEPAEDRHERGPMRLTGGAETKCHPREPRVSPWRSSCRCSRAGSRRAPSTGSSPSATRSSSGSPASCTSRSAS